MDFQGEITGMYAKLRVKGPGGGPFREGVVNIVTQILGVDPVLGLWKLRIEGDDYEPTTGFFLSNAIESFTPLTKEEYDELRAELIERYKAHEACPPDRCTADEPKEEKWYGDPARILEFLSKSEKEREG